MTNYPANSYPNGPADRASGADLAKLYALVLGVIMTVLGILGFIPGIAPNGYLFTIFAIDPVHNFFRVIVGLAGLGVALAVGGVYARIYAGVVGVLFVIVTVIGWVQGRTVLDIISVNLGDNILSLVIAVTALAVFFFTTSVAIVSYTHRHNLAS